MAEATSMELAMGLEELAAEAVVNLARLVAVLRLIMAQLELGVRVAETAV